MIRNDIKKLVSDAIEKIGLGKVELLDPFIEIPKSELGDYSVSVSFPLAKRLSKKPAEISTALAEVLNQKKPDFISKIQIVGGYINFFLDSDYLKKELQAIYKNIKFYGQADLGRGKTVIIEYSSPNIAKSMHIGHVRNTMLGDALARIYKSLGYKVVRWNYPGDWGTQFGKLIVAYRTWGTKEKVEKDPINELQNLYIKFHEELEKNPELDERAREEFNKLENGDKENLKLWKWFRDESFQEFNRIYKLLGVEFDVDIGESFYEKDLKPLTEELLKKGIAQAGDGGSIIVNLDEYNLIPGLLQKSDGASLYLTRDLANLSYRLSKYKPTRILYVVGNEQSFHFQQLRAIAEKAGLMTGADSFLTHVKYGMVLGEDGKKLSTRQGKIVLADEVISEAIKLAKKIVDEKNDGLPDSEKGNVAKSVGIGALKYAMLKEHRNTDIIFDWGKILDFRGDSGPYLQYTFARLSSILRKADKTTGKADFGQLDEDTEMAIIKHLLEFPEAVKRSGIDNLTNHLALYLYQLAVLANKFYELVAILKDENNERKKARLVLVKTIRGVLKNGLGLFGIDLPEKI